LQLALEIRRSLSSDGPLRRRAVLEVRMSTTGPTYGDAEPHNVPGESTVGPVRLGVALS
jgi:hypothetical protein